MGGACWQRGAGRAAIASPLSKRDRLATRDFDRLYRAPEARGRSQHLSVLAGRRAAGDAGKARTGIAVKGRLANAVVRNRIKRRLREILRRQRERLPAGWDVVVEARSAEVAQADFAALGRELSELLAKTLPSYKAV